MVILSAAINPVVAVSGVDNIVPTTGMNAILAFAGRNHVITRPSLAARGMGDPLLLVVPENKLALALKPP
jgi:hypothetical protein